MRYGSVEDVLAALVEDENGCLVWPHGRAGRYGFVRFGADDVVSIHRLAWEFTRGAVPADCELHHECENKRCGNAAHLRAVTRPAHLREHPASRHSPERRAEWSRQMAVHRQSHPEARGRAAPAGKGRPGRTGIRVQFYVAPETRLAWRRFVEQRGSSAADELRTAVGAWLAAVPDAGLVARLDTAGRSLKWEAVLSPALYEELLAFTTENPACPMGDVIITACQWWIKR